MSELEIPKGWKLNKLGDKSLFDVKKGKKPMHLSKIQKNNYLPYLDIKAFEKNIFQQFASTNDGVVCDYDDILLVWDGSRSGLVGYNQKGLVGSTIMKLHIKDQIISKYLYYFLKSKYKTLNENTRGGAIPHVDPNILYDMNIMFPEDKKIQKKIIQKIDFILEEVNEKKEQILALIQQNKARITIFQKNWSKYLIDNEIKRHPKRNEWLLKKLSDISTKVTDGSHISPKNKSTGDFYYITAKNVRPGKINLSNATFVQKQDHDEIFARCNPERGDVLLTKDGSFGYAAVNEFNFPFSMLSSVALIKPDHTVIDSYYLESYLNSNQAIEQIKSNITGSAIKRIILRDIQNLLIPLPAITTQKQIVQNIKNNEKKFQMQKSQFENIQKNYESRIKYVNYLESSILDSAFTGKLKLNN